MTAIVLLLAFVLPAEYGVDPLGTGRVLGLVSMSGAASTGQPVPAPAVDAAALVANEEYRVDARQITVPSLGSVEFKYRLAKGAPMLYSWRASAPLDFDFHTEPAGKPPEASETFERGEAAYKRGVYTAPYDGIHGWYWENVYDTDVVVTLDAAGFFTEGRLFLPNAAVQAIRIPERVKTP